MPGNPPITTRHRAVLIAAQVGESPLPTSFDNEIIHLNQHNIHGLHGILEQREEAGTSQFLNPTSDPTTLINAFQTIAWKQRDQHRTH